MLGLVGPVQYTVSMLIGWQHTMLGLVGPVQYTVVG